MYQGEDGQTERVDGLFGFKDAGWDPLHGAYDHSFRHGIRSWYTMGGPFTLQTVPEDVVRFIESRTVRSAQALFSATNPVVKDLGLTPKGRGLEVTDATGRTTTYFVDPKTSLINRIEFVVGETKNLFGRTVPLVEAHVLSNYRNVQGLQIAFKVERFRNGLKIEEMQFVSASHAAPISDAAFHP
jgi:hypothetical protein